MKAIYKVMMILAVILFVGTAGAVDHDQVSWGMAFLQATVSVCLFLMGWFGCRLEERRGR